MKPFELNEYVDYFHFPTQTWIENHGKVVGSATVIVDGEIRNLVMVKLAQSLHDPEGQHSSNLVAIHPDSLRSSAN